MTTNYQKDFSFSSGSYDYYVYTWDTTSEGQGYSTNLVSAGGTDINASSVGARRVAVTNYSHNKSDSGYQYWYIGKVENYETWNILNTNLITIDSNYSDVLYFEAEFQVLVKYKNNPDLCRYGMSIVLSLKATPLGEGQWAVDYRDSSYVSNRIDLKGPANSSGIHGLVITTKVKSITKT